jgi:hypothetical protein
MDTFVFLRIVEIDATTLARSAQPGADRQAFDQAARLGFDLIWVARNDDAVPRNIVPVMFPQGVDRPAIST